MSNRKIARTQGAVCKFLPFLARRENGMSQLFLNFPPVFDLESRGLFENGTDNPLSDSESSASSPTEGVSVKLFELMHMLAPPSHDTYIHVIA